MPRKEDNQSNPQFSQIITEQNQTPTDMEIEPENANQKINVNNGEIDDVPDLNGIEEEKVEESRKGFTYLPESFEKCFIPEGDYAKTITSITLKFLLAKRKYPDRVVKNVGPNVVYIINKSWYEKWKKFSRYETIKRVIKTPEIYCKRPIKFIPKEENSPGIINNQELLIRNKINDKDRNILVSDYNDCLDSKLQYKKDFKLLAKERFDLLNNYFKCDCKIKAQKIQISESKNYNAFSAHFKIVFLPTLEVFQKVNEENIEDFKKTQNNVYDIYFKQGSTGKDIFIELKYILFKNPQILSKMGIELTNSSDIEEIKNYLNKFQLYLPSNKNTKTTKEMVDYIFSNETINLIKKDVKIKDEDISITRVGYIFDLNTLFHLNWLNSKQNLDEVEKGTFFVEYINLELPQEKRLGSIFDIKFEEAVVRTFYEPSSRRPKSTYTHNTPSMDSYDLDKFTLDKEKNRHGLVGLNNLGNTCYMNTGLQCLSNCELLTKYFLGDYYKDFINKENPIGSQGEIVEKYSQLIHHLWQGDQDCISPIQFKNAFGKMYNAFKDYRQQDSQEFISYLLDSLHEDLNKVKTKPYIDTKNIPSNITDEEQFKIEKDFYLCRNQSFIADLIYGFYKSTVFCPDEKCKNISKSFEPFNMITLSLVNEAQIRKLDEFQEEKNKKLGIKIISVTFIPFKINLKPLKFPVKIKKEMDIYEFKKKIEAITGFNKNTFEIYKMQSTEFVPVKPNIVLLEDFLKGEKKIYLFQIPPYVFGKSSDYFDKVYEDLNNDHDKLFLEEEKYEGNDLYKEYSKKEKKSRTEDDLHLGNSNPNRINIILDKEEEKKEIRSKDDEDIEMKDATEVKDIEMKDETLNFNRKDWIKAEFYNYSYSDDKNKEKGNVEQRINNSRIIYLNREIDNSAVYLYITEMLEGVRSDLDDIKSIWFSDIQEVTKEMSEKERKKKFNIYNYFNDIPHHPLFLQYIGYFNYNKTNIMKKREGWKNSTVFTFNPEEHTIEKEIYKALENNDIEDIELLFKIIWKPAFSAEYNEGTTPIEIEKSEKLEEIFRNQRENEIINKNMMENAMEKEKESKKKNKKLKLEDLLSNFNEKEKLSKDNQWYCPKCKQFQLADKKMEIYSANEIVIIHLKRFRNNRKIENLVEFPLEGLNLKEYLPTKEDCIYDLFAVANHVGGLHGGHYFAYCKNHLDNEWYEFNDSNVDKIDQKKVVSDNAYVLFYNRRREEKINEEELFKKPYIEIDCSKYTK